MLTHPIDTGREVIVCPFYGIIPANTIRDGVGAGSYDHVDPIFTYKTEAMRLRLVEGAKNLYVVGFDQVVSWDESVERLKQINMRHCLFAANYLLGLMATALKTTVPEALWGKHLVAAEYADYSMFRDDDGRSCFFNVIFRNSRRELSLTPAFQYAFDGETTTERFWALDCAFLAEDLPPAG